MASVDLGPTGEIAWSAPRSPVAGKSLWQVQTYRRFVYAVLLVAGLVAVFKLLALAESALTGQAATIESAFGVATHCVGLAHFVIGFLFMASSRSMRSVRSRLNIAVALLIGAGLCWLYVLAGGHDAYPRFPNGFVFAYFMVHELRDEAFFYRQYKEAPTAEKPANRLLLLIGSLFGLLAVYWSYAILLRPQTRDVVWIVDARELSGWSHTLAWLGPSTVLALACVTCLGWAKRGSGASLTQLFLRDRPLWAVYATIPVFVALSYLIGGSAYSIVLLHVAAWWIFVSFGMARFGKKSGPRQLGLFGWMRKTQAGFQTLHVGLTLIVLAVMFVWVYRFGMADDSPLTWIAKGDSFYYWTIMHVTVSFVPKPA